MEYFKKFNKKQKEESYSTDELTQLLDNTRISIEKKESYSTDELTQLFDDTIISVENIEILDSKKYSTFPIEVISSNEKEEIKKEINSFFISMTQNYQPENNFQIIFADNKVILLDRLFHESCTIEFDNMISFKITSQVENSKEELYYRFIFDFDLKNSKDTYSFKFLIHNLFEIESKLYMFNIDKEKTKNNLFDKINEHYFNYLYKKKI